VPAHSLRHGMTMILHLELLGELHNQDQQIGWDLVVRNPRVE